MNTAYDFLAFDRLKVEADAHLHNRLHVVDGQKNRALVGTECCLLDDDIVVPDLFRVGDLLFL
jgi:hypothetical protein